jgi:RHS repeat-associated protein
MRAMQMRESGRRGGRWMAAACAVCAVLLCGVGRAAAQTTEVQRGFTPGGSYAATDIETIDTTNGNVMFRFPLGKLPMGRGSSPGPSISLLYNSKLWTGTGLYPSPDGGWRYNFEYRWEKETVAANFMPMGSPAHLVNYKVWVKFPDGSKHEFASRVPIWGQLADGRYWSIGTDGYKKTYTCTYYPDPPPASYYDRCSMYSTTVELYTTAPMSYYSIDGTYMRLDIEHPAAPGGASQWTLSMPNGARVVSGGPTPQRFYDRNNNYTEVQNITYNGHPANRIIDQLGRSLTIEYDAATQHDYVHAAGVGGEPLVWTIKWKTIHVEKTYYSGSYPNNGWQHSRDLVVVDQVITPAQSGGQAYTFGYNAGASGPSAGWGEVSSMTLPSGAQAVYTYKWDGPPDMTYSYSPRPTLDDVLLNCPTRKDLTYQREYDGASTPVTETWRYQLGDENGMGTNWQSFVTGPDGGVTYQKFLDTRPWGNTSGYAFGGLVYHQLQPDGTLIERKWVSNNPYGAAQYSGYNPYLKTEFKSFRDSAGNYSKTLIKDVEVDKNGNVIRVDEYDFVPYGSIPRTSWGDIDGPGIPAGAQLKRRTVHTYHNPTPPASDSTTQSANVYSEPGAPAFRRATASSEVLDAAGSAYARGEMYYDDPATTANLTQTTSWDSARGGLSRPLHAGNSVTVTNQYDGYGNLTLTTDERGVQTQTLYDAVGPHAGLYPTEVRTALGTAIQRVARQEYDFYSGVMTRSLDVDNDVATSTTYDVFGRPTLVVSAQGKPEESRVATEYVDLSSRIVVRRDLNAAGDGKLVTVSHFDQLGRVRLTRELEDSATQSAADETAGVKVQTRYLIGDRSSFQLSSHPYRAATAAAAAAESTMGWVRSKNDAVGRRVEVRRFAGAGLPAPWGGNADSTGAETTAFDMNYVTITDQASKARRNVVDCLGNLARVDEPDAANNLGPVDAPTQPTFYTYSALANLVGVTQGGQTRTYQYSSLGNLTSATNPESGTITYTHDGAGNLATRTDARGRVTTYVFDALNRPQSRTYSDSTPPVSYTYDAPGVPYSRGRVVSISAGVSTASTAAYDALGRVKQSQQVTDGHSFGMSYVYDRAGNMVSQTYPSGRTVTTTLNAGGLVGSLTGAKPGEGAKTYASDFAYTAHGRVASMRLGNGRWEHSNFNTSLQPVEIGLGASAADSGLLKLQYTYGTTNNNGDILSQTITAPGMTVTQTYTYDQLNRLASAEENGGASWRQTFLYDRYGNRRLDAANTTPGFAGPNPVFDEANNRITPDQGYAYDTAGNLTTIGGVGVTYDAESRQVSFNGGQVSFGYDGDSRRVKKVAGGVTTIYVYNVGGQLIAEYVTSGAPTAASTSYLTTDMLGTPRVVTDGAGNVRARHDYLPFGEELGAYTGGRAGAAGYGAADGVNQKFTGKERDAETGLDYFGARYYASAQGRFVSPDPTLLSANAHNPQTWNRYGYVLNNPLLYIDPLGLWEIRWEIIMTKPDSKGKTKIDYIRVYVVKTPGKDDNAATLVKQLNISPTSKLGQQLQAKIGNSENVRLKDLGGNIGRVYGRVESGMKEQANFNGGKLDPGARSGPNHSDCSRVATAIAFPQEAVGVLQRGVDQADNLIRGAGENGLGGGTGLGAKSVSEGDLTIGDIVRYAKEDNRPQHFATFIFKNTNGDPVVYSKSGEKGPYEIVPARSENLAGYGDIRGINKGDTGFYHPKQ